MPLLRVLVAANSAKSALRKQVQPGNAATCEGAALNLGGLAPKPWGRCVGSFWWWSNQALSVEDTIMTVKLQIQHFNFKNACRPLKIRVFVANRSCLLGRGSELLVAGTVVNTSWLTFTTYTRYRAKTQH